MHYRYLGGILLVLALVVSFGIGTQDAAGVGEVVCYFTSPFSGNAFQSLMFPQPASYSATVATNLRGDTGMDTNGVVGTVPLEWTAVRIMNNFQTEALGSGGSAVLSNNSSDPRFRISSESVGISGSRSAQIGNSDITYTLNVTKDGQTASCSVSVHHTVQVAPAPTPTGQLPSRDFPANATYSLTTKAGSVTAQFSYAKAVPEANFSLWEMRSFDTLLGNFGKGLFGAAVAAPGPAFRWDIANPLSIGGPEVIELTNGPSGGRGPIRNTGWAHVDKYGGASVAEAPDGEARVEEYVGLGSVVGMIWDGMTGKGTFGDLIDYQQTNTALNPSGSASTRAMTNSAGAKSMAIKTSIYTASGRFFAYGRGKGDLVHIFDLTEMDGFDEPHLNSFATVAWTGTSELVSLNVLGVGDFLIGRSAASPNPIIRIARLNSATGRVASQRSHNLSAEGRGIQAVTYKNKIYIFAVEKSGVLFGSAQDMILGVYEINPADLGLRKIHTMTIKNIDGLAGQRYLAIGSPDGKARPLIALLADSFSQDAWENTGNIRFYSTAKVFTSVVSTVGASDADFVLPKVGPAKGVKMADIVVNQWPFNAILKTSGNRIDLNFFRHAYKVMGVYTGNDLPFGVYGGLITLDSPIFSGGYNSESRLDPYISGAASIRADVINVTGLTGGSATPTTIPPPGGGSTTTVSSTSPIVTPPFKPTGDQCVDAYRSLCD